MPSWSILAPRPDPANFTGPPVVYKKTVPDYPPRLHPLVFTPIDLSLSSPQVPAPDIHRLPPPKSSPAFLNAKSLVAALHSSSVNVDQNHSHTSVHSTHASSTPSTDSTESLPLHERPDADALPTSEPFTPVLSRLPKPYVFQKQSKEKPYTQKQKKQLRLLPTASASDTTPGPASTSTSRASGTVTPSVIRAHVSAHNSLDVPPPRASPDASLGAKAGVAMSAGAVVGPRRMRVSARTLSDTPGAPPAPHLATDTRAVLGPRTRRKSVQARAGPWGARHAVRKLPTLPTQRAAR